jgi:hypothetical protein
VRDSAEALAGRRLVKALLEAGARVHVLAARRADDEIEHHNYDVTTVVPGRPFPSNKIGRALQMVRTTVPEDEGTWVTDAVAAGLQVLSSLPGDTMIYGRACPGASNVVAWHLARQTGLPWVAHFSDEWPVTFALSKGRGWFAPYKWPLFQLWRRRILRDAGALTYTNPDQGESMLGPGGKRYLSKAFVVTHLPSHFTPRKQPPQFDVFHLAHTGNLYPGQTSAGLMQGLRLFLDRTPAARGQVRFTQAGRHTGDMPMWTEHCGLSDVVRFVGHLSQTEVVALADAASLLIGLDYARPNSTTLISKMPDYLNAGRPILALTAPFTSMGRLFDGDGAGLTALYDSPEQVADRIGAVYEGWQRRRLEEFLPQPTAIESFTCPRVLAELAGAFVVARNSRSGAAPVRKPSAERSDARRTLVARAGTETSTYRDERKRHSVNHA